MSTNTYILHVNSKGYLISHSQKNSEHCTPKHLTTKNKNLNDNNMDNALFIDAFPSKWFFIRTSVSLNSNTTATNNLQSFLLRQ